MHYMHTSIHALYVINQIIGFHAIIVSWLLGCDAVRDKLVSSFSVSVSKLPYCSLL